MSLISNLTEFVAVDGNRPMTDSRRVAKRFGRRHDNVLQAVDRLDCSERFRLLNFQETIECRENPKGGKPIPSRVVAMTKDGFMFLVMGFTGKAAAAMKEAFIEAFNVMAEALRTGLWQRRMDAEAALLAGKSQASVDGRSLRRWQIESRERLRVIDALDAQMQLPLHLH